MKLALCQLDSHWESPAENLVLCNNAIDEYIKSYGKPDIFIFPECFNTAYTFNLDFAEDANGPTLQWMLKKAAETDCAICGSMPFKDNDKYFNRLFFVTPEGILGHYDKRHLFFLSGENDAFSCGDRRVIVSFRGVNILLSVCYDLRFPVWLRNSQGAYDLMINVANWPDVRIETAYALTKARAIENLSFAAFCNRTGDDDKCHYNGRSAIFNSKGDDISCEVQVGGFSFITAELDMQQLMEFKRNFPAYHDSDNFKIEM
ncbi:MAG: nitrilase family protein [Bacteroidales bacterium]|nr:nitrilase family protein [Bacteroidales bacterium]